jgi:uncharacterized integral membrane protein (TIGR00698 family)
MIAALFIGIAMSALRNDERLQPGLTFCVKTLLRWAVALLGLRILLGEIADLGLTTASVILVAMVATIYSGVLFARAGGRSLEFGVLAGMGTAICGASATLATSSVLPDYKGKEADTAFVVVAVNALSTVAMLVYPMICAALGFDEQRTGVMLGGTIHDVAQVVGAGYAVSEQTGNTAVIVKLYRVFLLLPFVAILGWYFLRRGHAQGAAPATPVPGFAIAFVVLCVGNSVVPYLPGAQAYYEPVKGVLSTLSQWGLVIAIAALGIATSPASIVSLGWRHLTVITGTTVVILCVMTGALLVF